MFGETCQPPGKLLPHVPLLVLKGLWANLSRVCPVIRLVRLLIGHEDILASNLLFLIPDFWLPVISPC